MKFSIKFKTLSLAFLLILNLVHPLPAFSQTPPESNPSQRALQKPTAQLTKVRILSAKTGLGELKILISPLQKEELKKYTILWLNKSEEKVSEYAGALIAARDAPESEMESLAEKVSALREEKREVIERTRILVDELKAKGGEVEDYEKYLVEVSQVGVEISGVKEFWVYFKIWLTSQEGGLFWLKKLCVFFVIIIVFWFLGILTGKAANKSLSRYQQFSVAFKKQFSRIIRRLTIFVGLLVGLATLNISITPMLAFFATAGLVLGLALQSTLSSLFCGIMILLYRPFDLGDLIKIESAFGKVSSINLMTTTITTFDNQRVHVPNEKIWGNVISNLTGNPTRRVDLQFGIGYADDIAKAQQVLEEIVSAHPKVLKEPAPVIKCHELGDSSVNFIVRPWANTEDYWDVYWDITRSVKERFDAANISIPFPQRDIHLYQENRSI